MHQHPSSKPSSSSKQSLSKIEHSSIAVETGLQNAGQTAESVETQQALRNVENRPPPIGAKPTLPQSHTSSYLGTELPGAQGRPVSAHLRPENLNSLSASKAISTNLLDSVRHSLNEVGPTDNTRRDIPNLSKSSPRNGTKPAVPTAEKPKAPRGSMPDLSICDASLPQRGSLPELSVSVNQQVAHQEDDYSTLDEVYANLNAIHSPDYFKGIGSTIKELQLRIDEKSASAQNVPVRTPVASHLDDIQIGPSRTDVGNNDIYSNTEQTNVSEIK